MTVLDVRSLARRYGDVHAVQGVSFTLARGEIVALVGGSGSGKSTVARLLARLEAPSAGRVLWGGEDLLAGPPTLAFRARLQLVFQDPFASLNPVHTVRRHLERPLITHGKAKTRAALDARVAELLGTVGLTPAADFAARRPGQLSGGQRQRVAIARALAVEPEIIVADEPTSMLDPSLRAGILELFTRLVRERGVALLFITHDLASAARLADRLLVMHAGAIVEEGPARAVVAAPAHPYTQRLLAALPDPRRRRPHAGAAGPREEMPRA